MKAAIRAARTPAEKALTKEVKFMDNLAFYINPKNTPRRKAPMKSNATKVSKGTKFRMAVDGVNQSKPIEDDRSPKSHRRFPKTPGKMKASEIKNDFGYHVADAHITHLNEWRRTRAAVVTKPVEATQGMHAPSLLHGGICQSGYRPGMSGVSRPLTSSEPAEAIEPVKVSEPVESKLTEAIEPINPIEATQPIVPMEPINRIEATEPLEMDEGDHVTTYNRDTKSARRKLHKWVAEQTDLRARETVKAQTATEVIKPVEAIKPTIVKKPPMYKDLDDFFAREHELAWGKPQPMPVSEEKQAEIDIKKQLEEDAATQRKRAAEAEKQRLEEEKRRIKEEEARVQEEQRRQMLELMRRDREKREQEEAERLARTGELRKPRQPLVSDLSVEWNAKVMGTLHARPNAVLAKTPEAAELRLKDFQTVVPPRVWLNDEIVNGTLMHVANWVNQKAGVEKPNTQTPKSVVFNSFVGKNLLGGKFPSDRILRKNGVRKDNFLEIQSIMIPICRGYHWTLVGVRPKHREVFHLDSLDYKGDRGLMIKALDMVKSILKDAFVENEWKFSKLESPQQMNSDDCGVHTITNGMCLGLGIKLSTYSTKDIPQQRLRIAAVCLNEGFEGDLTLDGI